MAIERNFKTACDFIRAAALQGSKLAVLPEYHLLNWLPNDEKFKAACSSWKTYLDGYVALAKECKINIVPGTIVELHDAGTKDERLLNVAYFITDAGEIAGKYVKKNLWGSIERLHLTSSSSDPHPVFDTPLGRVGMLICWDLAFPEAFREMIAQGAKMIIIPTFWTLTDCSKAGLAINPVSEGLFLDSMLTARCFENTCGMLRCADRQSFRVR
jgi:predicted amidohydrolase